MTFDKIVEARRRRLLPHRQLVEAIHRAELVKLYEPSPIPLQEVAAQWRR